MRNSKSLWLMGLIVLVAVSGAFAQDQTGMIYGNVTTEDGATVSGATVIAESPALIRPFETVTNARGRYVLPVLPIGSYKITAKAENYQPTAMADIQLSVNNRLRIDIILKAGVVGEEVVVITGEQPLVDIKKTDTGMNISKELFEKLPKGRNFTSIVALAPGATDESDRFGGIMIDGASSSENTFVMDGASTNDIVGGRNSQNAVFEFVEEVQVRSGGYDAEYGGSMGGVVNVVTRSGGNEFSGSINGYYSSQWLDSDPRDILRIDPFAQDVVAEYWTPGKTDYNRYDVGGSLGGYLLKDKVWFFASYMPYFNTLEKTVDFLDNNEQVYLTDTFEQDRQRHYATGKVTVQLTDKWNASVSASSDFYKQLGSYDGVNLPSFDGLDDPNAYDPDYGYRNYSYVMSGRSDYFVSDDLYLSGTIGYHKTDDKNLGQQMYTEASWYSLRSIPAAAAAQMPANRVVPAGTYNYYYYNDYLAVVNNKQQMSSSLQASYFTELSGDHQFKFGFQSNWIKVEENNGAQNSWYFIYWGEPWTHPITGDTGGAGKGEYGYVRVVNYGGTYAVNGEVSTYRYALYAQDSWSPSDRLTINFGIRTESEALPYFGGFTDANGSSDYVKFDFEDKLAPRIGVSYDLFGDGKFQLFGNFGVYYDVFKLEASISGQGGFNWVESRRAITAADLDYWNWPSTTNEAEYPGTPIGPPWDRRDPTPADPDLKPMGIFEYIAGFNWQFAQDMSVNVRFVHKNLRRAVEDIADNPAYADTYIFANPGSDFVKQTYASYGYDFIPAVEAVRDYYGLDVRLLKRFSDNWTGGVNFTLSRLRGNYSGLTNTDEGDRDSPNVNRNFDAWWNTFDANWNEVLGPLQSDRRYTTTIFGTYVFTDGILDGLSLGVQQIINDGTPFTSEFQLNSIQSYYPYGRADEGRYDMITRTDLYAEYNFKLGDDYTLNINANITNLFDQDGELARHRTIERSASNVAESTLPQWYQSGTPVPVDQLIVTKDPRYGMTNLFQGPRSIRLGAKITF